MMFIRLFNAHDFLTPLFGKEIPAGANQITNNCLSLFCEFILQN